MNKYKPEFSTGIGVALDAATAIFSAGDVSGPAEACAGCTCTGDRPECGGHGQLQLRRAWRFGQSAVVKLPMARLSM
jgi:hypothetical protein